SNRFHQNIIMHPKEAGKRIDVAINEHFEHFSRAQIQKWLKEGSITVNGRATKTKHIVLGDEEVEINIDLLPTNVLIDEDINLKINFEDDDIIVIDKPVNM
ncbi:S4 domain-containing protein, partial [Francisella tularensis subsp. holarctica]|uniref:S4 domain-containing protein n=1 Tax=Francisella tularensis TaxID=263 RepID=UPI002381A0A2